MPHKDERIEQLVRITDNGENSTVYAANLASWSNSDLEEFEKRKILLFRGYSEEIRCDRCHKRCPAYPKIVEYPDGQKRGVWHCMDPEDGGRLEFELDELKYWEVNKDKLPKPTKRNKTATYSRKNQKTAQKTLIISTLLNHHKFGEAESKYDLNFEPLKQEELGRVLGWKQTKVCRALQRCFPAGFWKRYIKNCKTEAVSGFLKQLDDEQTIGEAVSYRPQHPTDTEEKAAREYE